MTLKYSANLGMMFTEEEDSIARIGAAAAAGFKAVEFLFIYDLDLDAIRREMDAHEQDMSVINIAVGEGIQMGPLVMAAPGRQEAFKENLAAGVKYASALKPTGFVIPAYMPPEGVSRAEAIDVFKENLPAVGDAMGDIGVPVLIEALNPDIRPNSILRDTAEIMEVIDAVGHPNIGIEYDVYHMYTTEPDMIAVIREHLDLIGNIQIADTPGRGEPGTGEIDYGTFLKDLDELGYDKWVALEYMPTVPTLESLEWMKTLAA